MESDSGRWEKFEGRPVRVQMGKRETAVRDAPPGIALPARGYGCRQDSETSTIESAAPARGNAAPALIDGGV